MTATGTIPTGAPVESGGGAASSGARGAPVAGAAPSANAPVLYGGFWRRFWAFVIDGFIIGAAMTPFGIGLWGTMAAIGDSSTDGAEALAQIIAASMFIWLVRVVVSLFYGALFESSAWQATPGKKVLGLKVTDLEGRRVSFARATGRAIGKWLSSLTLCIGFIMVAFTEKKQGLHDLLAGTVVRR